MIHPSLFLRRAIQADAIFSGVSAVLLTFGAGELAPWLSLPEALLRETGLFLIAYAALVGWLGTRQSMPKLLVIIVIAGNAAWTIASIALLFSGAVTPNLLGEGFRRDPGDCGRCPGRAAIYRAAQERRRGRGVDIAIASTGEAIQSVWIASSRSLSSGRRGGRTRWLLAMTSCLFRGLGRNTAFLRRLVL